MGRIGAASIVVAGGSTFIRPFRLRTLLQANQRRDKCHFILETCFVERQGRGDKRRICRKTLLGSVACSYSPPKNPRIIASAYALGIGAGRTSGC